jgi:hypothetical protein
MDLWLLALARLGQPSTSFALVGRWVGHMRSGRFVHAGIGAGAPVRGELALGWIVHYAVGIAYALALVALAGAGWVREPTLLPALAFGVVTVAVPLFVMQPAMGAGIAGARTPAPWQSRARSLANHAVFGVGLYVGALAANAIGL